MRTRLVRLTLPPHEVEARLGSAQASGQHDDLGDLTAEVAASDVAGIEDLTASNDRPLIETAVEILAWLNWH